jgi:hypothetical protein
MNEKILKDQDYIDDLISEESEQHESKIYT